MKNQPSHLSDQKISHYKDFLKDDLAESSSFFFERRMSPSIDLGKNFGILLKSRLSKTSNKSTSRLVTILHGTGQNWYYPMLFHTQKFLSAGFDVCLVDLDGHGDQSTSELGSETMASMLSDLSEAIPNFVSYEKRYIYAYSLGGCFVRQYLQHYKKMMFDKIAFSGFPYRVHLDSRALLQEFTSIKDVEFLRRTLQTYGWYNSIPSLGPIKRREFPIRIKSANEFNYLKKIKSIFEQTNNSGLGFSCEIPVLFVFGEKDRIAQLNDYQHHQKSYKKSSLFVQKRATHANLLFYDYLSEVIDFFTE